MNVTIEEEKPENPEVHDQAFFVATTFVFFTSNLIFWVGGGRRGGVMNL